MVPLPVRIVFSFGVGVWVLSNIKLPPLEILVGIDLLPIILQEVFIGLSC
jgi:flagellar biosynthetic protein FliR